MRMQNGVMRGFVAVAAAVICLVCSASGVEIVVSVDFENLPDVSASDTQTGQGAFTAPGGVWNSITPSTEPEHAYYGDIIFLSGAIGSSNIVDSQGNATGISVSAMGGEYVYSWNYYDPNSEAVPCTSHAALMNDWIYSATQSSAVVIGGLAPGFAYDLALYGHSHEGEGSTMFTVGSVSQTTGYATAAHALTAGLDYVVYNDVVADALGKITFKYTDDPVGEKYGGLNGFQIRGEAYEGPPIVEPSVADANVLSGAAAAGTYYEPEWLPTTVTDGKGDMTGGVECDWVAPSSDPNPRLAVWGFSGAMNRIRIWGLGDLNPDEVAIKSSTSLITPTTGSFPSDLADSYETVLLEMTQMAGTWTSSGTAGDQNWPTYYVDYGVNVPVGTQSLLFDFGASGRIRVMEVQAFNAEVMPGDANNDGDVDQEDAAILATYWLLQKNATWGQGDFNGDGKVDDVDATIMAANWGKTGASAAVPEPSLAALLCGALAVFWCRRR